MKVVIVRFETYAEIALKPGELGFCFETNTLYIGTDSGFRAASSDAEAIELLKRKVDATLDELKKKIYGDDDVIDQVKQLDDAIRNAMALIEREIEDENARLEELINVVVAKIDEVKFDLDDKFRTIQYKSLAPDWTNGESTNKFVWPSKTWKVNKSGFALVQIRGLCGFKVAINDFVVVDKTDKNDEFEADVEQIFSQVFQVEEDDVVSVTIHQSNVNEPVEFSCKYIPPRVIRV